MPTKQDLIYLQKLPLDLKIMMTKARIREWVSHYGENGCYVSFSGGKDSTVLLHIVRDIYPNIEAVFVNTGLEYPEIQLFVKSFDNVTILRPKMRFDEVIKKYGYPFISKEVSECVSQGRLAISSGKDIYRLKKLNGTAKDKNGNKSLYNKEKWQPLLNVDFLISSYCCNFMKKKPAHEFLKKYNKVPITAQTAQESNLRTQQWLKSGCNAFNNKNPISNPMSFWTEQDVLHYIDYFKIPIATVYGDIIPDTVNDGQLSIDNSLVDLKCTGCQRTGCIFCGFGAHLEKGESRFERLKRTHPVQYKYCMGGGAYDTDGFWKPTKYGLGMSHCIDELNKIYGNDFIKY